MKLPQEMETPGTGNVLARLAAVWPRMEEISRSSLRDYFDRLTTSWATYSGAMSPEQKRELISNVMIELQTRANALEKLYPAADESSPSSPIAAQV